MVVKASRRDRLLVLADEIARLEDLLKAKQAELEELMRDRRVNPTTGSMPAVRAKVGR